MIKNVVAEKGNIFATNDSGLQKNWHTNKNDISKRQRMTNGS